MRVSFVHSAAYLSFAERPLRRHWQTFFFLSHKSKTLIQYMLLSFPSPTLAAPWQIHLGLLPIGAPDAKSSISVGGAECRLFGKFGLQQRRLGRRFRFVRDEGLPRPESDHLWIHLNRRHSLLSALFRSSGMYGLRRGNSLLLAVRKGSSGVKKRVD